jgi:hypothetical protein
VLTNGIHKLIQGRKALLAMPLVRAIKKWRAAAIARGHAQFIAVT